MRAELLRLDESTINSLLSIVDRVSEKMIPEFNRVQKIIKATLPDLELPYNWGEVVQFVTTLYIIGLISYSHEKTTRYSDDSSMKPIDYVKDLPIVKVLPKIHAQMSTALNYLETYIVSIPI